VDGVTVVAVRSRCFGKTPSRTIRYVDHAMRDAVPLSCRQSAVAQGLEMPGGQKAENDRKPP